MTRSLLRFLETTTTKEELLTALKVINEFKAAESRADYITTPFQEWSKLEQLVDYLKLLTSEDVEEVTDATAVEAHKAVTNKG